MCGDLEPVRRILAAEDYFTALACEVHQSDEFVLLSSGICPDRFDANHARCIRSARSPREFVRGVERLFRDAGRGFCAFATDMRTAPAQLTLALREADYAPEPGVVQVLDRGSRRRFARRRDIEVIKLTSDAATQAMGDWATLAAGRYAGWDPPGIAQSAVELDRRRLEAAGLGAGTGTRSGGCAVYLAYELGQAVGCIELFVHEGIAKLDRLYVLDERRESGGGCAQPVHGRQHRSVRGPIEQESRSGPGGTHLPSSS